MPYRKLLPALPLQPFVVCYYCWESSDALPRPIRVESPPNGFAAMVFVYGDRYGISSHGNKPEYQPRSFVTGQATRHYCLTLPGRIGMIGVVFKPAALATIFRFRMAELTNARIDLTDALGREGRQLTEQVCEASSLAQRIGLLDDFLLRRLAQPGVRLNAADQAADLIVEKKGNVTIERLAGETGVGRRYLEQQFVLKVGISPKHYARIQRIGHICNLLVHQQIRCQQPPNWHDYIYQAGYYDQSHFIREFLQFMDRQPSLYYKTNCELQHWLEAEAGVATG